MQELIRIEIAAGVVLELVPVPGGEFLMGSGNDFYAEAPAHAVRIPAGLSFGRLPVTQIQWQAVMGENPSAFRDSAMLPVEGVDWNQTREFCRRLSRSCGLNFRLPSESEWEYACRAGTGGDCFFKDGKAGWT